MQLASLDGLWNPAAPGGHSMVSISAKPVISKTSITVSFTLRTTMEPCFFIIFISKGMVEVRGDFKFTNDSVANIVIGLVYFCVIACSFFITYKVVFRKSEKLEKLFAKIAPLWSKVTSLFGKKRQSRNFLQNYA